MRMLLVLLYVSISAYADLDSSQTEGLKRTQQMMNNRKARQEAIKNDPKAKEIDAKAGILAGSDENKDEMYGLSSELLEKIAKETNGDPAKMQRLLLDAQKDPNAFYEKYFDSQEQARVRELATKIQGHGPAVAPGK